jgi:hypothetical protein
LWEGYRVSARAVFQNSVRARERLSATHFAPWGSFVKALQLCRRPRASAFVGFADVMNRFGGNCFGCRVAAHPEWDSIRLARAAK